jgi:hypothetical protein
MNTQHAPDLIDILRGQYTRNNDGGGLHGTCRVDNNALLELCRMTEELIKQRDELLAAAKITLRENLDLADGDCCTLYDLRTAVESVAPEWDMYDDCDAIAKAGG